MRQIDVVVRDLEADLKYHSGVLRSFTSRPIEQVGTRTAEQQRAAKAEHVAVLAEALALARKQAQTRTFRQRA